ncbi:MarR family winged helix-turn-helix transcriptional regulator [Thauera sinica]|uniref:MarR family winged helix-turn-helix transcriptional regulator n=1 Tax=Thauera sinica TaxID=2665146 RepID=A0ABW1AM16_9RHOO|nr:MarR family transcriptional regulator [Thauera sp. K11]
MKPKREEFAVMLYRCAVVWRGRVDERLRPWDMSYSTWRILKLLLAAEQRYNQRSLAAGIGVETPTLVRLLDRMEKLGLVRREPDGRDRRQKHVDITPDGRALMAQIDPEVLAVREQMLSGLADAELQAGVELLAKILRNATV